MLAIECDGATYHSALWARERDRLRQHLVSTHQAGRQHDTLLTAGQTAGGIREILPVADLMRQLMAEAEAALARAPKPGAP